MGRVSGASQGAKLFGPGARALSRNDENRPVVADIDRAVRRADITLLNAATSAFFAQNTAQDWFDIVGNHRFGGGVDAPKEFKSDLLMLRNMVCERYQTDTGRLDHLPKDRSESRRVHRRGL
jgi:hypothetical protein